MDRRAALGLATSLPVAFAASRADACTLAVDTPGAFAARLPVVAELFAAWFRRDELAFLDALHGPVAGEPTRRLGLLRGRAGEDDRGAVLQLYARYFDDAARHRDLITMTAIGDKVFVAVNEHAPGGLAPDCSGLPTLHLFLVGFRQQIASARLASVAHIASEPWTGHGQSAHWSGQG